MGFEVNGLLLDEEKLDLLISEVKKNKEYEKIEDSIILDYIRKYAFMEFSQLRKDLDSLRDSKFLKGCVKYVRSNLRRKTTLYLTKKTRKLIQSINNKGKLGIEDVKNILKSHRSTKERFDFYEELYEKILSFHSISSSLSKQIEIADIGCGLNPFSYIYFPKEKRDNITFYVVDIDKELLDAVVVFFHSFSINGQVFLKNALEFVSSFNRKITCVLLFRLLEVIDDSGHKNAERLIKSIDSMLYVASFARRTISGRKMTLQKKPWFERMLARLGFKCSSFCIKEEIFYFFYK